MARRPSDSGHEALSLSWRPRIDGFESGPNYTNIGFGGVLLPVTVG